jgi:hypothetical protein
VGKAAKRNWRRIVELWQESGLTKSEFCRTHTIPERKFSYYSLKFHALSKDHPKNATSPTVKPKPLFAQVKCKNPEIPAVTQCLILHLNCGGYLELPPDFDPETLKRVLQIASDV